MSNNQSEISNPCCCLVFTDDFTRMDINEVNRTRYQQADYDVQTSGGGYDYHYFVTPWTSTITDWSISGGAAVTTTSGVYLRLIHGDTGFAADGLYVGYSTEIEYDLTFTGTGEVVLGTGIRLMYDDGEIIFDNRSTPQPEASRSRVPFALSSGSTYRIKIRKYELETTTDWQSRLELWIDDTKIKKTSFSVEGWNSWLMLGSGTLAIDNLTLRRMYNNNLGFTSARIDKWCTENCFRPGKCVFPWQDDSGTDSLPAQIQADIAGIGTSCGDCTSGNQGSPFGDGTYVLDLVDNSVGQAIFGGGLPCATYQISDDFNCYQTFTVMIRDDELYVAFTDAITAGVDDFIHNPIRLNGIDDTTFLEHMYTGDSISVSSSSLNPGGGGVDCRFTQLDLTAL